MMDISNATIENLAAKLDQISEEVKLLRRSLLGSYDQPGGYAQRVVNVENQLSIMWRKVDKATGDIDELNSWVTATKNRAIGISIGLAIGGAGVGAGVTSILIKILGG